jgi:hypothetical protein
MMDGTVTALIVGLVLGTVVGALAVLSHFGFHVKRGGR